MRPGPMNKTRRLGKLLAMDEAEKAAFYKRCSAGERRALKHEWQVWARPAQLPPPGDWRTWLVCAGRGFGKTRAGAEWVRDIARRHPGARIALVASSLNEARAIMVEGESGLLAVCPPRRRPRYEPSLRRLTWRNGTQAFLYSAAEPETLRGPQHDFAWCDEIAKWNNAAERAVNAWNNLAMGLRLGGQPRVVATTTPRVVPLVARLLDDRTVKVSRGSMYDNVHHLPERFVRDMRRDYRGTALGRQELDGEMLAEAEGSLWSRALLERCREDMPEALRVRTVVAVDPPAGEKGDACGIIVAALLEDGKAVVLADASVERAGPERWARAVANAARVWGADRVVAEANQGGAMVKAVLMAADEVLPVKLVHASQGKVARAEPVAALYENGKVRHAGMFARLEDELCGLMAAGRYDGPGRSPDRADALVWALTELMLGKPKGRPRVRGL